MKYSLSINDEDYIKFNIFTYQHSSIGKNYIRIFKLVCPLLFMFIVFLLAIVSKGKILIIIELICFIIFSVIWFFISPKLYIKNIRREITKWLRKDKKLYDAKCTIEFFDDGFIYTTDNSTEKMQYMGISQASITNEYIFLYKSQLQAIIIPIRCIEGDENKIESIFVSHGINVEKF